MDSQYRQIADRLAVELSDELVAVAASNDRVSMSVILNERIKEPQVAFIGVYDAKDNLIAPVGVEKADGYRTSPQAIISGEKALGSVVVEMRDISRAAIIAGQWLFLVAMLVLHVLIWVAYSYLARPSKALVQQITEDVRNKLLAQGLISHQEPVKSEPSSNQDELLPMTQKPVEHDEQQSDVQADNPEFLVNDSATAHQSCTVHIRFDDPYQLLDSVGYDSKHSYLALCNQMLEKSIDKLLSAPLLAGVSVRTIKPFDDSGASVELVAEDEQAKLATAAMLLAQLIQMVNRVVLDKHRELGRFALPMHTTASDTAQANAVYSVSKRRRLPMVMLFGAEAKAEIHPYVSVENLESPNSLSERECITIASMTHSTAMRLRAARDAVLLEDE